MSKLYVNTIYPQSGNDVFISGNLDVSGTLKAYRFQTNVEEKTVYLGTNNFGNSNDDRHHFTGSVYITGSLLELRAGEATAASITLIADQGDDAADTTTISVADGGNFTIDCASDIILDADGADISLKDDGTQYLKFTNNSGDCEIYNGAADKDIIFKDLGGNTIVTIDGGDEAVVVADDKKLYFGTGKDASIEYDEDGNDELIISGAAGGVDLQLPPTVADALTITGDGTDYVTVSTQAGGNRFVKFHQSAWIIDDTKLLFGNGGDASFEYDEDGNDVLLYAGAAMRISDDVHLQFGSDGDAKIYYDETSADELVISGAAGGVDLQLPPTVADALTITGDGTDYVTVSTQAGGNRFVKFHQSAWIIDDTKLLFGDGGDASFEYDEDGTDTLLYAGAALRISDDVNLEFGSDGDAKIYYDETSADELVISGAAGGVDLQLPAGTADAFTVVGDGNNYITVSTQAGANRFVKLHQGAWITDDKKLLFGDGGDAYFEYDEDGTDTLLYGGAALRISDDVNLEFGTGGDAKIYYDETSSDELIISGAAGGVDLQLPPTVADAFTITGDGTDYVTVSTQTGQNRFVKFHQSAWVVDDTKLIFGNGGDISLEYDEDGTDTLLLDGTAAGMTIADDVHLYFGTNLDAKIYYDETSSDELIISGAAGGVDLQLPAGSADGFTITGDGNDYVTVSTQAGQNRFVKFHQTAWIIDDTKLLFGNGGDISLEYDEDGTDTLLLDGTAAGLTIADDVHLYFGTNLDAKIYYDETSSDELIISGAAGGVDLQLPAGTADAFTIIGDGNDYVTVSTQAGANRFVKFHQSAWIIDDTKLLFGNGGDASFEYDEDGTDTLLYAGAALRISDDVQLQFGDAGDAKIYYDETSSDELIISGAAGGVDLQLPAGTADAFTVIGDGNDYMTVSTQAGQNRFVKFHQTAWIIDDTKLLFGNGGDISLEYDEDGTDTLLLDGSAQGMTIADDVHLYFGTNLDAKMYYNEDSTDKLIISGSTAGIEITGSTHFSNRSNIVFGDPINLANDTGGGEAVFYGSADGSLAKGALYYLNTSGVWASASADVTGSGHDALLGISLGTNPNTDGMLTRGYFDANTYYRHAFQKGKAVYIESGSSGNYGYMSGAAPTAANSYVRIVGYATDTANVIYFNPGTNWVELS